MPLFFKHIQRYKYLVLMKSDFKDMNKGIHLAHMFRKYQS